MSEDFDLAALVRDLTRTLKFELPDIKRRLEAIEARIMPVTPFPTERKQDPAKIKKIIDDIASKGTHIKRGDE